MANEKTQTKVNIKRLCVTAVMLALAAVLSMITIFKMPMGGSITPLSMLPIIMLSIMYGAKWGVVSAFIYSIVQLLIDISAIFSWGLSAAAVIGTVMLDYIIAFTVLGLGGILRNRGIIGITIGTALAVFLRFVCHFLSGVIIFGQFASGASWVYSLTYNGTYMLPELIITVIVSAIIFKIPQVKKICNM